MPSGPATFPASTTARPAPTAREPGARGGRISPKCPNRVYLRRHVPVWHGTKEARTGMADPGRTNPGRTAHPRRDGVCADHARTARVHTGTRRIDVHQHVIPPARAIADRAAAVGWPAPAWDEPSAIAMMDRWSIATAVLSYAAPLAGPDDFGGGREAARGVNEYTAELVKNRPDRFGHFAALPLAAVRPSGLTASEEGLSGDPLLGVAQAGVEGFGGLGEGALETACRLERGEGECVAPSALPVSRSACESRGSAPDRPWASAVRVARREPSTVSPARVAGRTIAALSSSVVIGPTGTWATARASTRVGAGCSAWRNRTARRGRRGSGSRRSVRRAGVRRRRRRVPPRHGRE